MNKYLLPYILLLSLLLTACNEDVFIEPIEVTPATSEIGPDNRSDILKVSGKDWHVCRINYSDGDNCTFGGPDGYDSRWVGNVLNITTSRSSLSVEVRDDEVEVRLDRYLAEEKACLIIDIEGEYQQKSAEITIMPTGSYTIEIKDVSYNLTVWSGYPAKDYSYDVYTVGFTQGLAEPTDYSFAPIKVLPIIYWFRLRGDETEFTRRLLDSRIRIPVPEYTWYTSLEAPQAWMLLGKEVPLSSQQSSFDSAVMIPAMPAAVSLPAGKPLDVTLSCRQECIGLQLTVSAVDPMTGATEEVPMQLCMYKPEKFTAEVRFK